jgi:predicted kinase
MRIRPKVIIIRGPPAVGKTTIANLLAKRLPRKTAVLSIDKIAKLHFKYNIDTHGRTLPYKNTLLLEDNFLKNGFNVIIEDAFCDKSSKIIENFFRVAEKYDAKCFLVHLTASDKILSKRNQRRNKKPVSNKKIIFLKKQALKYRYGKEILIDTSNMSSLVIRNMILKLLV